MSYTFYPLRENISREDARGNSAIIDRNLKAHFCTTRANVSVAPTNNDKHLFISFFLPLLLLYLTHRLQERKTNKSISLGAMEAITHHHIRD